MSNFLEILAEVEPGGVEFLVGAVNLTVCFVGVGVLAWWIGHDGFGGVKTGPIRRNCLPYWLPFGVIFVWLLLYSAVAGVVAACFGERAEWVGEFANYCGFAMINIGAIGGAMQLSRKYFARGVRGLGLDVRHVWGDLRAAVVHYVAVLPLVWVGILVVMAVGKAVGGEGFEVEQHQSLTMVGESDSVLLMVVIVVFVAVVVPVFEEIIFRGLLQSMIVGFVGNRWGAIAMTSVLFTMLHPKTHWLGLFALSMCMGYAYEKSGSLLRPIFIHAIFNGVNVAAALVMS